MGPLVEVGLADLRKLAYNIPLNIFILLGNNEKNSSFGCCFNLQFFLRIWSGEPVSTFQRLQYKRKHNHL
jgi:hypothetical protein